MSLPRISIKSLMALVVLVGVALAALARPNNGWASFISAIALASLPTSLLGAIFRRGLVRAGWVGFAIFGWSFFSLTLILAFTTNTSVEFDVRWTLKKLPQALDAAVSLDGKKVDELLILFGKEDSETRARVAYSVMGLMFALLGGRIARSFARAEITGQATDHLARETGTGSGRVQPEPVPLSRADGEGNSPAPARPALYEAGPSG